MSVENKENVVLWNRGEEADRILLNIVMYLKGVRKLEPLSQTLGVDVTVLSQWLKQGASPYFPERACHDMLNLQGLNIQTGLLLPNQVHFFDGNRERKDGESARLFGKLFELLFSKNGHHPFCVKEIVVGKNKVFKKKSLFSKVRCYAVYEPVTGQRIIVFREGFSEAKTKFPVGDSFVVKNDNEKIDGRRLVSEIAEKRLSVAEFDEIFVNGDGHGTKSFADVELYCREHNITASALYMALRNGLMSSKAVEELAKGMVSDLTSAGGLSVEPVGLEDRTKRTRGARGGRKKRNGEPR